MTVLGHMQTIEEYLDGKITELTDYLQEEIRKCKYTTIYTTLTIVYTAVTLVTRQNIKLPKLKNDDNFDVQHWIRSYNI